MLDRSHLINPLLLAGISLGGWLLYQWLFIPMKQPAQPNQADAFIVDMFSIRMSAEGVPKEQLITSLMVHYPLNNSTNITKPHLILYSQKGNPWHLYADKGQAQHGTKIINLWNNVHIQRAGGPDNAFTKMTTPTLTIYPNNEIAETPAPVTIEQPGSVVNAIGMRANLKTDTINLLSQVRGQHEKTPN